MQTCAGPILPFGLRRSIRAPYLLQGLLACLILLALIFPTRAVEAAPAAQGDYRCVVFVNTSGPGGTGTYWWDNAFKDLSAAIDYAEYLSGREQCSGGVEVWVAKGTYTPSAIYPTQRQGFRLYSGVAIYGGFTGVETLRDQRDWEANQTILSGEIGGPDADDNCYHVLSTNGLYNTGRTAVLDGFIIRDGGVANPPTKYWGGGIFSLDAILNLANLVITENIADDGGGLYINGGTVTLENVLFVRNMAIDDGGGVYTNNTDSRFNNVVFLLNYAQDAGGGMAVAYSSLTITNTSFLQNQARSGGGLTNFYEAEPNLANVVFRGNIADSMGGAMENQSNSFPITANAEFAANSAAAYGGAVMNWGSEYAPIFANTTFSKNSASHGGAIYNSGATIAVVNSIFWENSASVDGPQIFNENPDFVTWPTNSIVQGCESWSWQYCGTDNGGNLDADPQFVSPGDMHISRTSLAIDAGEKFFPDFTDLDDDGDVNEPVPFDLDMNPRMVGAAADIGAYEMQTPNHAPTTSGPITLPDQLEDAASLPGMLVSDLLAGHASDEDGDPLGLAVIFSTEARGKWQFSHDGVTWTDLGDTTETSATLLGPSARLRFLPGLNWNGWDEISVRAWDGADGLPSGTSQVDASVGGGISPFSATWAQISVTVTPVNDAPGFVKGPDITIEEDAGLQTISGWASQITPGAPDEAPQALAFSVVPSSSAYFSTQPSINANGDLTFAFRPDQFRDVPVTVQLKDNGGTANGGVDTSPAQTFTIHVTPVNDPPSFTRGPDQTVLEDAGPQTVTSWAIDIQPGPKNEMGSQHVIFNLTNGQPELFSVQPALNTKGTLTYTPAPNKYGTATVLVTATDSEGASTWPVELLIHITPVNDPPRLEPISEKWVREGDTVNILLNANDNNDQPAPNKLTYSVSGLPAGASYQIDQKTGMFSWQTTEQDGPGAYPLTFTVTDDGVPALSASQTATVNVGKVNDLKLSATAVSPTVLVGTRARLTLIAHNPNPDSSDWVTVSVWLPEGVTFDPAESSAECQALEGQEPDIVCTVPNIPPNSTQSFNIAARIDRTLPDRTPLIFSGDVVPGYHDPNYDNNKADVTITAVHELPVEVPDTAWEPYAQTTSPCGGETFLGEFNNQTVRLGLNELAEHYRVRVTFDLLLLRSWDGNQEIGEAGQPVGPDIWEARADGETLLRTTFSNWTSLHYQQAYPGPYPTGDYSARTGAIANDQLCYTYNSKPMDSRYRLSFTFDHQDDALLLDFLAQGLQSITDESWGLDNVTITLLPEMGELSYKMYIPTLWKPSGQ